MIVLDTHIWVWWVNGSDDLKDRARTAIEAETDVIFVPAISLWEFSMLVSKGKISASLPAGDWLRNALSHPLVKRAALTPEIAVLSTELPGEFHKDPADRMIVATAMHFDCTLVTEDDKIRNYPHVTINP